MGKKQAVYFSLVFKFYSVVIAFLYILILVAVTSLCLFPIFFFFSNVEPSSSLFSLCLSSPFLCVAGILLPASATEHAEKKSFN